ncbi:MULTISPECIES: hypothetical protein [Bacillus]|uniref:hypothetical protein n=1 Tax=Bacillus TaxID=1386 RepID=UPI000412DE35|nr:MULTISPECIES: hypothetical protein [Bacillus]QHZ48350.1 hypothetical protein M654_019760 [Bacillus sp. NSP9.1]
MKKILLTFVVTGIVTIGVLNLPEKKADFEFKPSESAIFGAAQFKITENGALG